VIGASIGSQYAAVRLARVSDGRPGVLFSGPFHRARGRGEEGRAFNYRKAYHAPLRMRRSGTARGHSTSPQTARNWTITIGTPGLLSKVRQ
jgi:hypothetical protein